MACVVIFIFYFYYLDDKRFALIIPFSSSNQLAQNVREGGLRVARAKAFSTNQKASLNCHDVAEAGGVAPDGF